MGSGTTTGYSATTSATTTTDGGEREDGRLRGSVFLRAQSDGVHPRELPESWKAGHGLRRRLHDVHRRLSVAARADGACRWRVQGRAVEAGAVGDLHVHAGGDDPQ